MSRVANLNNACAGRRPARLRVPPQQLEVHNCVIRRALDKFFEYGRPFLGPGHFVQPFKDYLLIDLIVP